MEFDSQVYYAGQKILACHYDYRLDNDWYFLGGKFQNAKLFCHFLLHRTFTLGYLCTIGSTEFRADLKFD
jgi:hypothetical protein